MSISNKAYDLTNISYQKNNQLILEKISCHLESEKIYAVIGASGAGKTTLLKLLAGLIEPSEGRLLLGEESVDKSVVSIVPQDYGLLPWQKVKKAVLEARKMSTGKKLTKKDQVFVEKLLQRMALTPLIASYPSQLSGGQKQRVAIARSLAVQSDVLLMDEPFSALDAFTRETAQQLFLDCWEQVKRLTIFVTHDIDEALLLAHEVIVLSANPGRIQTIISSPFQEKNDLKSYRQSEHLFSASIQVREVIENES